MSRGKVNYTRLLPVLLVTDETYSVVEYLMKEYNLNKSQAIRHILDNGIQYMAMHGDGVGPSNPD